MEFVRETATRRLVHRSLRGETDAFAALVHRNLPAVHAVARAYTGNDSDADDVVQEAFVKAWKSLDTLHDPARFAGWTVAIARNLARAHQNRQRRESETLHHDAKDIAMALHPPHDDEETPLAIRLRPLVEALDPTDREIVHLRYTAGKKTREIATLLTMSHSAVRKRLERTRQRLGAELLNTLAPDDESTRRIRDRATHIASAVAVITPPWKPAAASVAPGVLGGTVAVKALLGAAVMLPVLAALTYLVSAPEPQENTPPPPAPPVNQAEHNAPAPANAAVDPAPVVVNDTNVTGASVTGRFFEEDTGNGVANATIRLRGTETEVRMNVQTGIDGTYAFSDLSPGRYQIDLDWDDTMTWRYPRNRFDRQERILTLEAKEEAEGVDFTVTRGLAVRGAVRDNNGKPLPGAVVRAWTRPNEVETKTETDESGQFVFFGFSTELPAYFWPRHEGLALPPHGPVDVPPEGLDGLVLTMVPESTMAGYLVDQEGNALPNTRITPWPSNMFILPRDFSAATDDEGRFQFTGLHASEYHFNIQWPDETNHQRLHNRNDVTLAEGESLKALTLVYEIPGDLTIAGTVMDDIGAPRQRVDVTAIRGNTRRSATTDEDGRFVVGELGPGVYTVKISGVSWSGFRSESAEVEAGTQDVRLMLPRKGSVSGQVVDKVTGEPLERFEVKIATGARSARRWEGFENGDGRFELPHVAPGINSIVARAEGYATGWANGVEIESGESTNDVVVALERASVVHVQVLGPDSSPVRDATIGVDDGVGRVDDPPRTDGDGRATIHDAHAGVFRVYARHPDFAPGNTEVRLRAGEEATATIQLSQGAVVQGVARHDGLPLEGVRIELLQQLEDGSFGYSQTIETDASGAYQFAGVPAGTLTFHANPVVGDQYRVVNTTLVIQQNEERVVDLNLETGAATAVFDVTMDESLRARDGRVHLKLTYEFSGGEFERFYTYHPLDAGPIVFKGVYPGTATLEATYRGPDLFTPLADIPPREITIQEGPENHFEIAFQTNQ